MADGLEKAGKCRSYQLQCVHVIWGTVTLKLTLRGALTSYLRLKEGLGKWRTYYALLTMTP